MTSEEKPHKISAYIRQFEKEIVKISEVQDIWKNTETHCTFL